MVTRPRLRLPVPKVGQGPTRVVTRHRPTDHSPRSVLPPTTRRRPALADELDVTSLIQGAVEDHYDGLGLQPKSGIQILIHRLGQRFGELEVELTIRAIIEFMNFYRTPSESIDQALSRFDILYHRASTIAGLELPAVGLAYLMLRALHIDPSEWPVLFMPWGGAFPNTAQHLNQLKTGIRQQAHMMEQKTIGRYQGATHFAEGADTAEKEWTADGDTQAYQTTPYNTTPQELTSYPSDATWTAQQTCELCGIPATQTTEDVGFDTDTDEDDGQDDPDYNQQVADDPCVTETLHDSYLLHKRRWRRHMNRRPRRVRLQFRRRRNKGKGKGNGKPSPYGPKGFGRYLCIPCATWEDNCDTEADHEQYYNNGDRKSVV